MIFRRVRRLWQIHRAVRKYGLMEFTGRKPGLDTDTRAYFEISDQAELDYRQKLDGYLRLADAHFDVAAYHEFCATHLADLDQRVLDWATSGEFDKLIVDTVKATYPEHEQDRFIDHLRGLTSLWTRDETARLSA